MEKQKKVYLDYAATTPISSEVYREMLDAYTKYYGNTSSIYSLGVESDMALMEARVKIAKAINAEPNEIYFTSGGCEANNWAIKGLARANKKKGNHIITSCIEHPSVLDSCKVLEQEGFKVTYIPVDEKGVVNYAEIIKAIGPDTILISIMTANNIVGTLEPIRAIAELAKANEVIFHTDAVSAIGNIPLDVKEIGIDAATISSHKIFGPKGVGVLYLKNGVEIDNLIDGGEQEFGKRAGTSNVPACIGMAKAVELACMNIEEDVKYIKSMRRYFLKTISEKIHNISLNGHTTQRIPNNISISFEGVEGEALVLLLDKEGIYVSTSSACASISLTPSHVLTAMGVDEDVARSTIRFTISKAITKEEIDYVAETVRKCVKKLRSISAIRIYKNKVEL